MHKIIARKFELVTQCYWARVKCYKLQGKLLPIKGKTWLCRRGRSVKRAECYNTENLAVLTPFMKVEINMKCMTYKIVFLCMWPRKWCLVFVTENCWWMKSYWLMIKLNKLSTFLEYRISSIYSIMLNIQSSPHLKKKIKKIVLLKFNHKLSNNIFDSKYLAA